MVSTNEIVKTIELFVKSSGRTSGEIKRFCIESPGFSEGLHNKLKEFKWIIEKNPLSSLSY